MIVWRGAFIPGPQRFFLERYFPFSRLLVSLPTYVCCLFLEVKMKFRLMVCGLSVGQVLLILCLFCFSGCEEVKRLRPAGTKTLLSQVLESRTVRIGYVVNPPALIKDPNSGELSGIYFDAVQDMGKNLGLEFKWVEETGWATMVEGIEARRYDVVVGGIWPSSQRGKRVVFSRPLYFSPVNAYVKNSDVRFSDYAQLDSPEVTIATLDGEMTSIIASTTFPKAKTLSHSQDVPGSQLLLDVVGGKADVTFLEKVYAEEFLTKNPGTIKAISNVKPLRFFGNTIVLPMGEEEFVNVINVALGDLLASGLDESYLRKYERYPGSFLRVAPPFLIGASAV